MTLVMGGSGGVCTDKCLTKIDGKRVVECLRRRKVLEEGDIPQKVNLIKPKNKGKKSLFFPGCSLKNDYGELLSVLREFFKENDIETYNGCCLKNTY